MDEKYENVVGASSPYSARIFPMVCVRPLEQIRRNRSMYVAAYIISRPLDDAVRLELKLLIPRGIAFLAKELSHNDWLPGRFYRRTAWK